MGTWSITPNTGLASIDNTGKLTYQEHTEDRVYTISYSDDTCGTITKEITIKKCEGPGPCPDYNNITLTFTNQDSEGHNFGTWNLHDRNGTEYQINGIGYVGGEKTVIVNASISPSIPEGVRAFITIGDDIMVDGWSKDPPIGAISLSDCEFVCDATWQ